MSDEQVTPRQTARLFFQAVAKATTALTKETREAAWQEAWEVTQWTWRAGFSEKALPPPFTERIRRALKGESLHPTKDMVKWGPDVLRETMQSIGIIHLESIGRVRIVSGPRCEVPVIVKTSRHGRQIILPYLICENAPFSPTLNGQWGVNPVSCSRVRTEPTSENFTPPLQSLG